MQLTYLTNEPTFRSAIKEVLGNREIWNGGRGKPTHITVRRRSKSGYNSSGGNRKLNPGYELPIPWRPKEPQLKNNKTVALRRLNGLMKKCAMSQNT